jgi:hypothetical protein
MRSLKRWNLLVLLAGMMLLQSCRLWEKVFPPKYGCKTNGKNVGAEQLLSENPDKKARKAAKKAKKFKA